MVYLKGKRILRVMFWGEKVKSCVASVSMDLGSKERLQCFARAKMGSGGGEGRKEKCLSSPPPLPTETLAT